MITLGVLNTPEQLLNFVLLTFADLKAYRFTYWLGVPAIIPESPFTSTDMALLKSVTSDTGCSLCIEMYRVLLNSLSLVRNTWVQANDNEEASTTTTAQHLPLQCVFALWFPPTGEGCGGNMGESTATGEFNMQHISHAELMTLKQAWPLRHNAGLYFVYLDPSVSDSGSGWVVRNLLALLGWHVPTDNRDSTGTGTGTANPFTARIIGMRGAIAQKLVR
jgi:hypothetical protein